MIKPSAAFRQAAIYLWYKTAVPVFIERFLLAAMAAAFIAVVFVNPLSFDKIQRITAALALVFGAAFFAQTLYRHNEASKKTTQDLATTPTPADIPAVIPAPSERASVISRLVIDYVKGSKVNYHLQIENIGKLDAKNIRVSSKVQGFEQVEMEPYVTRLLPPTGKLRIPSTPASMKPGGNASLFVHVFYSAEIGGADKDFRSTFRFLLRPEDFRPQTIDPEGWEEGEGGTEVIRQAQVEVLLAGLAQPQGTVFLPIPEAKDGKPNVVRFGREEKHFLFDPTSKTVSFRMKTRSGRIVNLELPLQKGVVA